MKIRSLTKDSVKKSEAQSSDDFVILSSEECALVPSLGQETSTLLVQLEADLVAQLKVCPINVFIYSHKITFSFFRCALIIEIIIN